MPVDLQQRLLSRAPNRQKGPEKVSRAALAVRTKCTGAWAHTRANSIRTLATIAVPVDHDATPPMSTRALSLVVRLLTTACAGAALGTMSGCGLLFSCPEPWSAVEVVELGTTADILALTRGDEFDAVVAVGAGGIVVHHDGTAASTSNPVNVTLRGVVSFGVTTVVVGDGGTILDSSDRGLNWTPRVSGITDDLIAVARGTLFAGSFVVAISSGQIVFSADSGATWSVVVPPAQGWGGLRAVFATDAEFWAIGDTGVAWTSSNPAGAWTRQDLGMAVGPAQLLGGGRVSGDDDSTFASTIAIASSDAVWIRKSGTTEWTAATVEFDDTIVAYGGGFVVTAAGTIYDLDEQGTAAQVGQVEIGPRAIIGNWDGFVVAGDAGQAARARYEPCIGGRPFVLDGEPTTANLVGEIATPDAILDAILDPGQRQLAEAWARDGLLEHASVAAFARVTTELLSIGAPAELVRATQQAIVDELEHARMCFELASKHAGARLGAGSLPVLAKPMNFGTVSDSRAGSPVAIALAMLEEGCINESVAAAEAAVAASSCSEDNELGAETKSVLIRIAEDETRHAALAWRTLRWLLDTHPEVAPALRTRFDLLASTMPLTVLHGPPGLHGPSHPVLSGCGRLSSQDRAAIQLRVHAEMIAPLAARLARLSGPAGAVVTSGPALA